MHSRNFKNSLDPENALAMRNLTTRDSSELGQRAATWDRFSSSGLMPRRVLTIDVESVCRRLTNGLGDWEVACRSIAEATTRLRNESFDAILVVACGYGAKALPLHDVELIIRAASGLPVLVILEGEDHRVGQFALDCGAFVVLMRGSVEPADIRRRVALAIEMRPLRGSDALASECFFGNDDTRSPGEKLSLDQRQPTNSLALAKFESIES